VIPARGGSKRIPGKNIRDFAGRPMIEWSIETARESGLFDRVVVSTDDADIRKIAEAAGAEVPFHRPEELADDMIATRPVIVHAIRALGEGWENRADLVCCLYPTAPFTTKAHLDEAHDLLRGDPSARCVVPVLPMPRTLWRAFRIMDGGLSRIFDEYAGARSQDLPPIYQDAGQFYFARTSAWVDHESSMMAGAIPLILAPGTAVDIDTPEDWDLAEARFLQQRSQAG
jgi:pseudaminic acid cytidylyltransferase